MASVSWKIISIVLLSITIQVYCNDVCTTFDGKVCGGSDATCGGNSRFCDCSGFREGWSSDFGGVSCEVPLCYTTETDITINSFEQHVCSGNGVCREPNTCQCNDGYTGYNCKYLKSDVYCSNVLSNSSLVCSGRGKCLQPNECLCDKGYEGSNCEMYRCYGFLNTDPTNVCSGHGQCTDWNVCDCENGYSGRNCEMTSIIGSTVQRVCFGIPNTNSTTCSSQGVCVGLDTCICKPGYFGNECQYSYCFSIPQNDGTVCNGRGSCGGKDNCNCHSQNLNVKISGNECELIQCKGKDGAFYFSTDSSNVCSGRGICSLNGCNCTEGYAGAYCEDFNCFGISKDSVSSCSGNGECIAPDTCNCFSNSTNGHWIGDDCGVCGQLYDGSGCSSRKTCDRFDTCNGQGDCGENNNCVCDDGFKGENCDQCADNRYGWDCSISCFRQSTCSGHGDCSRDGLFCDCDHSQSLGYWKGNNCSTCVDGYFGDGCLTKVASTYEFNSFGNELFFDLNAPSLHLGGVVDCSKLFSLTSFSAVGGSTAKCIYKTSLFPQRLSVELSSTSSIKPGDLLEVNLKVFDNLQQPQILTNLSNSGSSITAPIAEIVCSNTLVRYTEGLLLTGRNSLTVSRERTLFFEWILLSSGSNFESLSSLVSSASGNENNVLNISSADLPANNVFSIQLRIHHTDFNLWSNPVVLNFTKEDQPTQSSARKYEMYLLPPTNPYHVSQFILPVYIPFELYEDGVKKEDTTSFNIDWSVDPDVLDEGISIFDLQSFDDGILYIECIPDFSFMKDTIVTVKGELVVNNDIVASSSFQIKYVDTFKTSISVNPSFNGLYLNISRLKGTLQQSYWECINDEAHSGKCNPELDTLFTEATNKNYVFVPNNVLHMYRQTIYVRAFVVINNLHYRLQNSHSQSKGLKISQMSDGSDQYNNFKTFFFVDRSKLAYTFTYEHSDLNMDNSLSISLFDQSGNNLTDSLSIEYGNNRFRIPTDSLPQESSFITVLMSYVHQSIVYKKNLYGYIGTLPSANCSTSITEQPISVPVFGGVFYFYNISFPCVTMRPKVQIILKNQGTELVACERSPVVESSQVCYLLLPELIGPTEVYVNIISGTRDLVAGLPVAESNEKTLIGHLRERQSTLVDNNLDSVQKMFAKYFSDLISSTNLRTQIKKLLILHYPDKELSYDDL